MQDDLVYIECEQGSEDWHRARAGCITASKVPVIRAMVGGLDDKQQAYVNAILSGRGEASALAESGYKRAPTASSVLIALDGGDPREWSDVAKNLAFRLACERIIGAPLDDDEFNPWQAARGQRLEPMAREVHEVRHGVVVHPMGFIRTSDGKFGCSVDGIIGADEGAEYKAFLSPSKLRAILMDGDWGDVVHQSQFSLAVTGRKRWHMGLYCPQLEPIGKDFTLKVIEREEDFIEAMWSDLWRFDTLVENYRTRLKGSEVSAATELPPWTAEPAPVAAQRPASLEPSF